MTEQASDPVTLTPGDLDAPTVRYQPGGERPTGSAPARRAV